MALLTQAIVFFIIIVVGSFYETQPNLDKTNQNHTEHQH